ncbi:hypothetical protein B566_EDAN016599 [Ephemera danica]|nr:hypothetical protein B566_EDAN016877 [Ephemera danica]KAF4528118.1 hypothetical protein B566_EDAN016599 [Ephemera danica]
MNNVLRGVGLVANKISAQQYNENPRSALELIIDRRYVGSRPIKLRKSMWRNRSIDVVRKKEKERTQLIGLLTGR